MGELIERQIAEAVKALEYADYQIGKMQEREKSTLEEKTLGYLSEYCERILQVVQNQQAQIDALLRARRDECAHPFVQNDVCVECGAPWSEVKQ